MKKPALFRVILAGRPNVGKSSLFNALLGYRRSIVLDFAGTTRDEVVEELDWGEGPFQFVDCFGAATNPEVHELDSAVDKADACLFVVDGKAGLTPLDKELAIALNHKKIPTLVLVNKTDARGSQGLEAFSGLPLAHFVETSAVHSRGLTEVRAWISEQKKQREEPEEARQALQTIKVALIGRPNAGKSTLMNLLCGELVSKVSPLPHTTRDPVIFTIPNGPGQIQMIDTAGIRRPRSDKEQVEVFSIQAATRAIGDADVVFLTVDASEKVTDQDMRLLNLVEREGKPAAVLLNFWDKLKSTEKKKFWEESEFAPLLERFHTITISGKTGFNVERLFPLAWDISEKASHRVPTSKLNQLVESIISRNPPPSRGNGNFNILYASQVRTQPPTFVLFVNRSANLPHTYQRYVSENLRNALELKGQALRVFFREAKSRGKNASGGKKGTKDRSNGRPWFGKDNNPRKPRAGSKVRGASGKRGLHVSDEQPSSRA